MHFYMFLKMTQNTLQMEYILRYNPLVFQKENMQVFL